MGCPENMMKINFTKASIKALKPTEKRYQVWDTKTAGLCIRISPTGVKTYQVIKKLHGRMTRITIGKETDLTVEQARNKASDKITDIVYKEIHPNKEERILRAKSLTLGEVYTDYKAASNLRAGTLANYKLAIDRDLKDWKDSPLQKITGLMVQKRHKALSKESDTVANKTMRVLRALFNYARDEYEDSNGRSLFPDNPTRKLKRQWNTEKRKRGHISQHQLKDWFDAVIDLPNTMKRGDPDLARDYLIFIALTGLRRREASSLQWDDIDLNAKSFIVRDTKNHDDLWMPLPDYLVDLLKERKATLEESKKEKQELAPPFQIEDPRKFVEIVRTESSVYFTIHYLRRTFITIAESLDIGVFTIKALVNHRSGTNDVTEGYIQINTERLREPMDKITNFILSTEVDPENETVA